MNKSELNAMLYFAEEHNLMNQPVLTVLNTLNQKAPNYQSLTVFDVYYCDYLTELQLFGTYYIDNIKRD